MSKNHKEFWLWKLLRHPLVIFTLGWGIGQYNLNNNLRNQLVEKDKEIQKLKDSRVSKFRKLELEKKHYIEKHKERIDDIDRRHGEERKKRIEWAASKGRLNQPVEKLSMDKIDKKYEREKELEEKKKNRYLQKIQQEIKGLRE